MRTPRVYVSGAYVPGDTLALPAEQTHHVVRVLRRGPGDPLEVFNGVGQSFDGRLAAMTRASAAVEVLAPAQDEPAPLAPIHLGLSVLKSHTLDYVLQKAVELGAAGIHLLESGRTEARKADATRAPRRLEHWQAILIAACEQCGRNWLPTLHPPVPLAGWLGRQTGQRWLLDPAGQSIHTTALTPSVPLTLAIGPEGGWTVEERMLAEQAGFVSVSLGPRILRADTAPVVALTLAQYLNGAL